MSPADADDQLQGSLREQLDSLDERLDDLEALFTDDDDEDDDVDDDTDDGDNAPADVVVDAVDELIEEIEELNGTFDHARSRLDRLAGFCEDEARAWEQDYGEVVSSAETLASTIESEAEAVGSALQGVHTRIEGHQQRLKALISDLEQRVEALATRTRDVLKDAIHSTGERFVSDLQQRCREPLERSYRDADTSINGALEDFRAGVHDELERLSEEVASLKDRLLDGIRSAAKGSVENAIDSLVDAASERIASTVTESITMTQLGTQLTSAMAPILPQMIAINKVAEAIRAAIKVFKTARMGL